MICWLLGWQKRVTIDVGEKGKVSVWRPVVYGAIPDILPGEPCDPTLVTPHSHEVTCKRCRDAKEQRGTNAVDAYMKKMGIE